MKILIPDRHLIKFLLLILMLGVAWFGLVSCSQNSPTAPQSTAMPTPPEKDNVITVHYNERPPYLVTTDSGVTGLTGDPVTIAFEKGVVPYRWQQTPTKRQIYILQQNTGQDCVIAWFKNAERESFAKFSLPVYQDEPQIALARADNESIPLNGTIEEFFKNPSLTLLVKDGYSYGDFIDQKIEAYQPNRLVTTNENNGMLKMIHAGHADYMFIAPEEADGLIKASEFYARDFKKIHFTDILSGENRYILCSMQVDDSIIEQLNAAIRQYVDLAAEE
jgi:ABC-type amino acid transport substrate-binding protein